MKFRLMLILAFALRLVIAHANPWNGKVVLEAFWWNYWNNNYPNNWSTYISDLAPRLRDMGIDAVWIPPTVKNKNATGSVGYAPFDQYDLGDKYQGNSTATRFGTKDQYLRAVAILHANGIDVIQDVVYNHLVDAGSDSGAGGQDPTAWSNQYKNFRYASYATPATSNDTANYGARRGRFPKNWQNFHPNPDHNTEADDITAGFWGPDICYYSQARGLSSNMSYNPAQAVDYMRTGMRNWSIWLKKQTGVDGFRLDAAKHFEPWATQDFLWNLANNAGFASGGNHMFAVGEYVGSSGEMDSWVDAANSANGGTTDLVGTFDFSLRGALQGVVNSNGSYDLGSVPGAQQSRRSRTVPFVNNHDTFRPNLDSSGHITGWDTANELGTQIDPSDVRAQLVHAIAFAVDGSPQVFFEDLFDLSSTGKRWTHQPTSSTDLPARDWLVNQIWCHQKLNFKDGAYRVRWQAADLLVIERSAHALIGANDNYSSAQTATVQTDFGANVLLHDYSGSDPTDRSTDASGKFTLTVPPCNGSNLRRGYCIWGPAGITGTFNPAVRSTTQEWEMSDDLGDSHPSSLGQGGALPANSTATRIAGKIYPAGGTTVTVDGFAANATPTWKINVISDATGTTVATHSGAGNHSVSFIATNANFYTIRVQNADATSPSQTVWVKATYTGMRNRLATLPVVTQSPSPSYKIVGETAQFTVAASGNPPPVIQWYRNNVLIPGATATTLTLTNLTVADSDTYEVTLSNEAGQRKLLAPLTVYPASTPTLANLNYDHPTLSFNFSLTGRSGLKYRVDRSGDLFDWSPWSYVTAPANLTDGLVATQQYYRFVYLP